MRLPYFAERSALENHYEPTRESRFARRRRRPAVELRGGPEGGPNLRGTEERGGVARRSDAGEEGEILVARKLELGLGRGHEGEDDLEGGALAQRALHANGAAVGLDDLPRDPQAQAEAAVVAGGDGALETAEDAFLVRGGDADAVVLDDDVGGFAILEDLDDDRLALAVLDGVGEEVVDDLVDSKRVPVADDRAVDSAELELAARFLQRDLVPVDHVRDHRGEVDAASLGL